MSKLPIIVIAGPTASGKTSMAVRVAERFSGEVVSADSMQIYKNLNIGTAKPTAEEIRGIPHHMINICDINDSFSVVDYCEKAHTVISKIAERGNLPIIAGGTGLYIDSLVNDMSYNETVKDIRLRNELSEIAEHSGNGAVYDILKELDEHAAASLHPNNLKRVIRAIEIVKSTGKSLSESIGKPDSENSRYSAKYIVLTMDREKLYERIDKRVDMMIAEGVYDEAKWLFSHIENKNATCLQAIGYKEFLPVINGEMSLSEAAENLKRDTRHYAKRQLTWFKRNEAARFVDCTNADGFDAVCGIIKECL